MFEDRLVGNVDTVFLGEESSDPLGGGVMIECCFNQFTLVFTVLPYEAFDTGGIGTSQSIQLLNEV